MILAINDLFLEINQLPIFCFWNASQFVWQRKRADKFFFSSRFRFRVVKQKALFLHVAKRNGALFFCNPVTGQVILLF